MRMKAFHPCRGCFENTLGGLKPAPTSESLSLAWTHCGSFVGPGFSPDNIIFMRHWVRHGA
jgi:hypothetical protein